MSSKNDESAKTLAVIEGCFDLLNNDMTGPQWLETFAELLNCKAAACVWWHRERPETFAFDGYGEQSLPLELAECEALEHIVDLVRPAVPAILGDLITQGKCDTDSINCALLSDRFLVACLDWAPARVFLVFGERLGEAVWQPHDKLKLAGLLPLLHKSVRVKKALSFYEDVVDINNKVNDEIPWGFINVLPDGELLFANSLGSELIRDGKVAHLDPSKRLVFSDALVQCKFRRELDRLGSLADAEVGDYVWYAKLTNGQDKSAWYGAMLCFKLDLWKTESLAFDRIGVIILENEQLLEMPSPGQLASFYGLTQAQARVVIALMQNSGVESAASQLNVSVHTVRTHLRSIYSAMGVRDKAELLKRVGSTMTLRRRAQSTGTLDKN